MGLLRIILALLVVGSHLGAFGGATFAVKAFFIISGFYMALVIDKRYYALPISNFYASRLMRLLPTYWVVGLLTLAAEILLAPHGEKLHPMASPLAYGSGLDPTTLPLPILIYIGLAQRCWVWTPGSGSASVVWMDSCRSLRISARVPHP